MRRMVLLRIGVDSGCGGIQSPLFEDGSFELVCIPDRSGGRSLRTYGNTLDLRGQPLTRYIGERWKDSGIHFDPEFESMTYGDPTRPKRGLSKLRQGDYLVFTCGLRQWNDPGGWDAEGAAHIYLAGYFIVEIAGFAGDLGEEVVQTYFCKNAHVSDSERYSRERGRLLLIKGGLGSRLFTKAVQISEISKDRIGRPLKVLSKNAQGYFGQVSGCMSIQRSTPRWVPEHQVAAAIEYLNSLE